jgi:RNA polymerase sigma-54 factor
MDFEKDFQALAKLDEEWRDYFYQSAQNRSYSEESEEKRKYIFDSIPQRESLQDHLLGQLKLAGLSEPDRQIGELLIGSINNDGYLTTTLDELAVSTGADVARLGDILTVVQDFNPTGVGARDLRECLLLQLERLGKSESTAEAMVRDHIDKLGTRRYNDIAKAMKIPVEEVLQTARLIATLDPKPGRVFSEDDPTYVSPEVVVQKNEGKYVVILNDDNLPHVRISKHYRDLLADPNTKPEVKSYIRERIRSGAFLIKSIHQRQKTIYRIASEIVQVQSDFLDRGIAELKPLTMAEVATRVGVHETTVSRAVSAKYMQTPVGMFEMKYFFTPGIKTANGGEISNKTVKDIIANLVADEESEKPLSDQDIMARLKEQGINVARRTIAKYRLMLRIPPSHLRRLN